MVPDGPERPRNSERTRERILEAARHEFTHRGFGTVTVRSIADRAGVAPNLITRYFGGKEGLFAAASAVELHVGDMFDGSLETLGARMADTILGRWTAPGSDDRLLALLRASGDRPGSAEQLAGLLDRESLAPLRAGLEAYGIPVEEAEQRARAVDVLLVGVTARLRMLRDELGDPAEARAWLGPAIQRLVDGP